MIEVIEERFLQQESGKLPYTAKEDSNLYEYRCHYTIKVTFNKSDTIKWSKAQRLFSTCPVDSEEEDIIISKHIKPGLEAGAEHFNRVNLRDRRIDLIYVCRNEISAVFLLSCREELSVDDIINKLRFLSKRLFSLRQFDKFIYNKSRSWLINSLSVQVRQCCESYE